MLNLAQATKPLNHVKATLIRGFGLQRPAQGSRIGSARPSRQPTPGKSAPTRLMDYGGYYSLTGWVELAMAWIGRHARGVDGDSGG